MNYEFGDSTFLADCFNKFDHFRVGVSFVDAESTLYSDRYLNLLFHLSTNLRDKLGLKHQYSPETATLRFLTRAATVNIYFIIAMSF